MKEKEGLVKLVNKSMINKSFKFNYGVAVNEHCFACTAGAGSSCGGTLT